MATTETRTMVLAASAACTDKKADDIRILELDPSDAGFTDFFLIASGTNTRQVVAISDEIEIRLKREFGVYANSVEGRRQGEWVLMDYVDFVVHIFVEEKRAFYDIERLRKSATTVNTEDLKAALAAKVAAVRNKSAAKKAATAKKSPLKKAAKKSPAKKATPKKAAGKKAAVKKKSAVKKAAPARKAAKKAAKKSAK